MQQIRSQRAAYTALPRLALVAAFAVTAIFGAAVPASAGDEQTAVNLATLLRSARAVISQSQKLINDANKGDKGLSGDAVVQRAKANYKKVTNADVDNLDMSTLNGQLLTAMLEGTRTKRGERAAGGRQDRGRVAPCGRGRESRQSRG